MFLRSAFQLMKPVRGIETTIFLISLKKSASFQLMKPVRGIETWDCVELDGWTGNFPINETRSRDWNYQVQSDDYS